MCNISLIGTVTVNLPMYNEYILIKNYVKKELPKKKKERKVKRNLPGRNLGRKQALTSLSSLPLICSCSPLPNQRGA
jgi:hypothetical protein